MPSTLLNFKQPITGLGRLKGMKKKKKDVLLSQQTRLL